MFTAVTQHERATARSRDIPLVIFTLAAQHYALAVHALIEVVGLPALTLLPGAPPYLCGLLNWHGQHLPVLDGRVLVAEPPHCDLASQVIIVGSAHAETTATPRFGLLVDVVRYVRIVPATALVSLPPKSAAPFFAAVFQDSDGRSTILLDAAALQVLAPALDQTLDQEQQNGPAHTP
jgi:chemotaxis signal transduction protein